MTGRDGGDWAPLSALPAAGRDEDSPPASRLSCDGETFEVRSDSSGGTHYAWLSGPNAGYGFTVSPTVDDIEQHRTNIRGFLSMVDPGTGYIEKG
jgi:hypothetical protein